jgi:putative transcriptional regulator
VAESLHPDADRLAMHAAGQLRPLERVVIEAHLAFCPPCVERLRDLLDPGARWLRGIAPEPVPDVLWQRLERSLDASRSVTGSRTAPRASSSVAAGAPPPALPAAAWEELDPKPDLNWRPVGVSGARFLLLGSDPDLDADLVLVGLGGGRRFPTHVHVGHEEVVMLAGGFSDSYGHLDTGDYYRYPPGSEHGPHIDPGEYCWTLGLLEHGVRFRGLLGVLQLLVDPRARRARRGRR